MPKTQRTSTSKAVARYKKPNRKVIKHILPRQLGMGVNTWKQFSVDITTTGNVFSGSIQDATSTTATPSIVSYFTKIRILKFSMEWIPAVGPSSVDAAARVYVATYYGGENMRTIANKTTAATLSDVKTNNTLVTFNAWERTVVPIKVTGRWIQTNTAFSFSSATAEEYERTMSWLAQYAVESPSASVTLGKWLWHCQYEVGGALSGTVDN
jgi:hypothetical protein